MKLLIDANLSPKVAGALCDDGVDAAHVSDLGLLTASDDEIFDRATGDGRVVVTADSDFGTMLALRRATSPSVVHLRHVAELGPDELRSSSRICRPSRMISSAAPSCP